MTDGLVGLGLDAVGGEEWGGVAVGGGDAGGGDGFGGLDVGGDLEVEGEELGEEVAPPSGGGEVVGGEDGGIESRVGVVEWVMAGGLDLSIDGLKSTGVIF